MRTVPTVGVGIYDCNGTSAQSWTRNSDGTVKALGKCLDVSSGSVANGAKVQLWTCNGSAAQQWTYSAGKDLVNPQANKCLDVTGNNSANSTSVQIWTARAPRTRRGTRQVHLLVGEPGPAMYRWRRGHLQRCLAAAVGLLPRDRPVHGLIN